MARTEFYDDRVYETKRRRNDFGCRPDAEEKIPERGDKKGGIEPGAAFEDLPESWECPICGAKKMQFKKID